MKKFMRLGSIFSILFMAIAFYGCADDPEYTLSLTVSGLNGYLSISMYKNLVKGDTLAFDEDGTNNFATKLTSLNVYSFTIDSVPSGQTCVVQNATGFISSNTTLEVLCASTDSLATVTGSVNGLASGETIYLALNNGQTQTLGSGSFSFDSLPTGYEYQLTLLIGGPGKHCTLTNSSGTISGNVTTMISCQTVNILFANGSSYFGNLGAHSGADLKCASIAYFMGPHITCDINTAFLSSSDAGANPPVRQLNSFTVLYSFNSDLPLYVYDSSSGQGETYFQANWNNLFEEDYVGNYQNLSFSGPVWSGSRNSGTLDVFLSCLGFSSFSGLFGGDGSGRVMNKSGLEGTTVACTLPQELACTCLQQDYQVGGTVSGLSTGNAVVRLTYNSGTTEDVTLVADGSFYFGYAFSAGDSYAASIVSSTTTRGCSFSGSSSGTVSGSSNTALTIVCDDSDDANIGGTVTGLDGTLVLALNDGDQTETITADGSFTFDTSLTLGDEYTVSISTSPDGQTCEVANASGTAADHVTNITVTCADNISVDDNPLASIAVTPTSTTVNFLAAETKQFTATGTYSDTTTADITSSVTWTSSATDKATISAAGLATPVALGTTNISATLDGITSNSATLTVQTH